jgi:hypothetical protein
VLEVLRFLFKNPKLIMVYKIVHHIVAVPTTILIPTDPRIRQFHPFTYRHLHAIKDPYKYSFFPNTIIHWNLLPQTTVWMITSCCAYVGIRNNNKFSQFITYLQVVPTEINFVVTEFIIISYSHVCATVSDHPVDG